MNFIIFLFTFTVLLVDFLNCKEHPPEPVKKILCIKMSILKDCFKNIKGYCSRIETLESKINESTIHYKNELYSKSVTRLFENTKKDSMRFSFDEPEPENPENPFNTTQVVYPLDLFAHQINIYKADISSIHGRVRRADNLISAIMEKTRAFEAVYNDPTLTTLAEEEESEAFTILHKFYETVNEFYSDILKNYEEINRYLYYSTVPLTVLTEDVLEYDKVGEQMERFEDCKEWAKNWKFVRDTVADLAVKDFSYDLYRQFTRTDTMFSIPVKKDIFRKVS